MPTVAIRNLAVLPGMIIHFDVNREFSVKGVEKAMVRDQRVFLVAQKTEASEKLGYVDLCEIGTIAVIKQVLKLPNKTVRVLVEGEARARLMEIEEEDYLIGTVRECVPDDDVCLTEDYQTLIEEEREEPISFEEREMLEHEHAEIIAKVNTLRDLVTAYVSYQPGLARAFQKQFDEAQTMSQLLDCVAIGISMQYADRQRLLECISVQERFMIMMEIMGRELEVLSVRKDIAKQIKDRTEKNQREYVLREQLKLIKEELGEGQNLTDEDEYYRQLDELKASKEVKDKIKKEIDRLGQLHDSSSESAVERGYIETLLAMPWDKVSKDNKDIDHAEEVLNEDHYGLNKVKERMLEFLAVRNLTKKGDSPIICLVGPPGTGKTSIAKSVARALGKKYIRICLGGVKDEAEIRGHRRTYVGAMPGRIAAGLKSAGVKNPLMLLDEIDKMSSDYKGDTASALLEVLDGEQNSRFVDHYMEIPLDLSEVLFIATANSLNDIPRPLLDRMEVIEVSSYTSNEKFHIAKEHLLAKQIEKNGLKAGDLTITDNALNKIIGGYTREAGVRSLERKLGEICRKTARNIYSGKKKDGKSIRVSAKNLEEFLGKPRFDEDKANETDEVGIVRGLAVTSVGGETLEIEVNIMPGKGELVLTGQLGDVMKESARAGITYIRSIAADKGFDGDYFKEHDFHIHIPEGAVPKDGPSAGISMATALYSAITDSSVRADVAMTGEITLRGRVLPIGGLKEKTLAAKNAGIKTVIIPKKNSKDADELEAEITDGIEIIPVETMDEVLRIALA